MIHQIATKQALEVVSAADIALGDVNVHKQALSALNEAVKYQLTSPNPKPVFLPSDKENAQNSVGQLLVPPTWSPRL